MATPSKKVVTTMFVRMAMEMEGETNPNPIPTEEIKTTMALETTDHQIRDQSQSARMVQEETKIRTTVQKGTKAIEMVIKGHQTIANKTTTGTTLGRKIREEAEDLLIKINVRITAPRRNKIHPQCRKSKLLDQAPALALKQLLKLALVHAQLKYLQFVLRDAQTQN